jgi:hypothetical protein
MKKLISLNIGMIITLTVIVYTVYYLLLHNNFLHTSIASIIDSSHRLKDSWHLLVLGLLPIYIGTMVFGSILLGAYLGSLLQQFLLRQEIRTNPPVLEEKVNSLDIM